MIVKYTFRTCADNPYKFFGLQKYPQRAIHKLGVRQLLSYLHQWCQILRYKTLKHLVAHGHLLVDRQTLTNSAKFSSKNP